MLNNISWWFSLVQTIAERSVKRTFDRLSGAALLSIAQSGTIRRQGAPVNALTGAYAFALCVIPDIAGFAFATGILIVAALTVAAGDVFADAVVFINRGADAGLGNIVPFIIGRAVTFFVISAVVVGTGAGAAGGALSILAGVAFDFVFDTVTAGTKCAVLNIAVGNGDIIKTFAAVAAGGIFSAAGFAHALETVFAGDIV